MAGGCSDTARRGHCNYPEVLVERMQGAERREREAISEAYRYRRLWECAASAITHSGYKPRGADERRMVAAAAEVGGLLSSGNTDGWLDFLPATDR